MMNLHKVIKNRRLFKEFFSVVRNLDTTKYNVASDHAVDNINGPTLKAALWNSEIIISINDRNKRKYTFNFSNVDETEIINKILVTEKRVSQNCDILTKVIIENAGIVNIVTFYAIFFLTSFPQCHKIA